MIEYRIFVIYRNLNYMETYVWGDDIHMHQLATILYSKLAPLSEFSILVDCANYGVYHVSPIPPTYEELMGKLDYLCTRD